MYQKYGNKFMCFSPPVMLATFIIEFAFAFYIIWRYKMNTAVRLITTVLFTLGTFQLAEYMICGGLGWTNVEWARLGYASITLLPALGVHLVVAIAGKKKPLLIGAAYASCAAFVMFFGLADGAVSGEVCRSNYAVFNAHGASIIPFGLYYYGWLIAGTTLAFRWASKMPERARTLRWMSIGYLAFILPTTTVNIVDPSTIEAIPSIMCGFAVILAFILAIKVTPNITSDRHKVSIQALRSRLSI